MRKTRSLLYRVAAVMGDVIAIDNTVRKRSARPLANRLVRKYMWRGWGSFAQKIFKGF